MMLPIWLLLVWTILVALVAFQIGKSGRPTPPPPPDTGGWMRAAPRPPLRTHPLDFPRVRVWEVDSRDDPHLYS